MAITVREALNIGKLREGIIVAGKGGLDRIISYVDILEVPDVTSWLREEELLLTTGYAIKEKLDLQVRLIEELARKRAAGLIIKKNRFLKTIPEQMIEKADKLQVPIILIPGEIPYIEITHPLLNEILKRQNEEYNTKEKLKELVKRSKELSEQKIKTIVRQIKNDFDTKPPFVAILIAFNKYSDLKKHVNLHKIKHSSKILSSEIDGNFFCICSIDSSWKTNIPKFLNKSFVNESKLTCIISDRIYNLQHINIIYNNLTKCLSIAHKIPWLKQNIISYDKICHYILLDNLSKQLDSHKFVKDLLRPLDKVENDYKKILIKTLYYYVKNGGNKTKAAKECYVHRNTFNYRMERLVEILNNPLDNPEELYKYRLALDLFFMTNSDC